MAVVIELFGPPHLIREGKRYLLSSRKIMGLLAYLAMRPGQPVSRSHIAGLLWADVPDDQARNNLRQALSQLRKAFRDVGVDPLEASAHEITLRPDELRIPAASITSQPDAVDLVVAATGPGFLEGLSTRVAEFDSWISTERQAIEARMARALEAHAAALRVSGRTADAIEAISACLRLDPLNEAIHRNLMELFAASGRPDAALSEYETCRDILSRSLGVEPSVETRDLAKTIRASRGSKATSDTPQPVLSQICQRGVDCQSFGSLEEALNAGLECLADNHDGRWIVAMRPMAETAFSELPGGGVYLDAAHRDAFGQDTKFTLVDLNGTEDLLRAVPVARNRMMVSATTAAPTKRIQDVLSLIVLPFRDMSHGAKEVSLGLVLAEEVSARLARFWELTVASPSAALTSRRLCLSHEELYSKLGVNFAVEGSVFRLHDDLRLSLAVTNLTSGEIIASERFEGRFQEIFEHQSDLVDKIATSISRKTESFAEQAARNAMTSDTGAFDWYLRGLSNYRKAGVNIDFARKAVTGFENALVLDPEFSRSSALKVCAISWYEWDYIESGQAMSDMRHALLVSDDDPEVHRIAGSLSMMVGDYEAGLAHAERAVKMNPSDAYLLGQSAIYWSWYGDPDKALPILERAMTLDPFLPVWAVEDHGVILYSKGDFEGAIASLTRLPVRQPRGLAFKAASQVALDDLDGAKRTVADIKRHTPDYTVDQLKLLTYYRDPAQTTALFDRLKQAGLS